MDSYALCFSDECLLFLNTEIYPWDVAKPHIEKLLWVRQTFYIYTYICVCISIYRYIKCLMMNSYIWTIQRWSGTSTLKSIICSLTWLYKYILLIRVDWWNPSVQNDYSGEKWYSINATHNSFCSSLCYWLSLYVKNYSWITHKKTAAFINMIAGHI